MFVREMLHWYNIGVYLGLVYLPGNGHLQLPETLRLIFTCFAGQFFFLSFSKRKKKEECGHHWIL